MPEATQHAITSTLQSSPASHVDQMNVQLHQDEALPTPTTWSGFVIVGDNIDKSVNACHQTMETRNRSLHYFNSYAVLDQWDFSHLPEFQLPVDRSSYDMNSPLLSDDILKQFYVISLS